MGRQPPPPSVLSKPSAPAPGMYEVSMEMFRPPLPLVLGGALADKLRRSSRRSVPANAFLRQLGFVYGSRQPHTTARRVDAFLRGPRCHARQGRCWIEDFVCRLRGDHAAAVASS
ncbi:hypothetical protein HPB50_027862 [Hyalomma asiaticum]|nr:hypothetical protein HPB50_027862 [Hyalomma asiaticum]